MMMERISVVDVADECTRLPAVGNEKEIGRRLNVAGLAFPRGFHIHELFTSPMHQVPPADL
jgi:hypothetical protein